VRQLLAAAAILLAACDGLFFAELDIAELRVTLPSQQFVASDSSVPEDWCDPTEAADPPCIATSLEVDVGAQVTGLTEENASYELRLTDVAMALATAEAGKDLGGVKLLTIRVAGDAAGAGVVIASYTRPPGTVAPTAIAVTGNSNVDLGPYLEAGRLPVQVELVLDEPTPAFTADVEAGFSLRISLDWGAYF
jgi:hypothetical protein